jgi:hypothetical protein
MPAIAERFERFAAENPHVREVLADLARQWIRR